MKDDQVLQVGECRATLHCASQTYLHPTMRRMDSMYCCVYIIAMHHRKNASNGVFPCVVKSRDIYYHGQQ